MTHTSDAEKRCAWQRGKPLNNSGLRTAVACLILPLQLLLMLRALSCSLAHQHLHSLRSRSAAGPGGRSNSSHAGSRGIKSPPAQILFFVGPEETDPDLKKA